MPSSSPTGFEFRIVVGIAELAASNNPSAVLATHSLGAGLALAIYDPLVKVGGLVHLLLPDSNIDPGKAAARPGMFVDTGGPALLEAAGKLGAQKNRLKIYLAGGAQIIDSSGYFNIGKRNHDAVIRWLSEQNLSVEAEQTGGLVNLALTLHLATGEVRLKTSGQAGEQTLCKK